MPVIDDIKENHKKAKEKGLKYAVKYYFGYYALPAVAAIAICAFLFSIVKTVITAKDMAFEAIMVNAVGAPDVEKFAEKIGVDLEEYDVYFDNSYMMNSNPESYDETTYTNAQKIMAVIASGSADVMLADEKLTEYYSDAELFGDLRLYFDEETLNGLDDKILWHTPIDAETGAVKGDPFPYAIEITDSPVINDVPCYFNTKSYFMVVINTKHPDYVRAFYDYLYE